MAEEPTIGVLVERISNVKDVVDDIKDTMATKGDQAHTDQNLVTLTAALALERTERIQGDKAISERQQLVEDRQEARKFQFLIAIATAVIVPVLLQFVAPLVQR